MRETPQDAGGTTDASREGYVGRIPVRNLWLLMLYASDLYRTAGHAEVALDENPDEIPDTIGRILVDAVTMRQRRRLTAGYRPASAVLTRVRGRIDVLRTERHQLLERGAVACRFEEFTADTPRNRFVRAALESIGKLVRRRDLARQCAALAYQFSVQGVSAIVPTRASLGADRYGRHDADDRWMVDAAKLAMDIALPTEDAGRHALPLPDREGTWIRKLFEKAVGGYYAMHLRPLGWRVERNKRLGWQIADATAGIAAILPGMEADIVLDDPRRLRRLVIDTKFNAVVTKGWYRDETVRNAYLYQIYTYLRSQSGRNDALADSACGILLHPAVDSHVDESVVIQGHRLRFATVDLAAPASVFRTRLLELCGEALPAGSED